MVNFRFLEIAERTRNALSKNGVLGRHLIPLLDDINKGGVKYIRHAFDNHIPVKHKSKPDAFHRAGDKLTIDFESFVDSIIATTGLVDGCKSAHEAAFRLGDELNAHEEGMFTLDDETYDKYAAVYDLLMKDVEVALLIVYFAYQEQGRDQCAHQCQKEMDEQTLRFAKFIEIKKGA